MNVSDVTHKFVLCIVCAIWPDIAALEANQGPFFEQGKTANRTGVHQVPGST